MQTILSQFEMSEIRNQNVFAGKIMILNVQEVNMGIKPVIVVVAYRRLHTLQRLLRSIGNAIYNVDDITLIISIDYHPENQDIVKCAEAFEWKYGHKIVRTHQKNIGLRSHIIECGDYSVEYGAAIILEDDLVVAPSYYEYTRLAHEFYKDNTKIAGVSLYAHEWNGYAGKRFQPIRKDGDVYFGQFSCTWGESWTGNQWTEFRQWYKLNPQIKIDELMPPSIYEWKESWGKYFARYLVETNRYYVMPYKPVSTVFGETGTHASRMELDVQVALYWGHDNCKFIPFEEGIHYDLFFESIDIKSFLAKKYDISEADICIDIYALNKRKYGGKRYVLTARKLNCCVIDQYELNMRPHDINVLLDMKGKGIYFYDTLKKKSDKEYRPDIRLEYDFAGVHSAAALSYVWKHSWKVVSQYFKNRK